MDTRWPTVLSAASGAFSAIATVSIAIRTERRSREVTKVQMYLMPREGFLTICKELGELEDADDAKARLHRAPEAYWLHAYDEWRLSGIRRGLPEGPAAGAPGRSRRDEPTRYFRSGTWSLTSSYSTLAGASVGE